MTKEALVQAIAEAERFMARAKTALAKIESESAGKSWYGPGPYIEVSAVRRASMDLTRALATLRKG